jgi:uncharacterized protein (TIGR00106 family)
MIVAEVSIAPFGVGTSLGPYVRAAVEALRGTGLRAIVGPMGTVIEVPDLPTLFRAVEAAHDAVRAMGGERISITLKVDARYDKDATAEGKLRSIGEGPRPRPRARAARAAPSGRRRARRAPPPP